VDNKLTNKPRAREKLSTEKQSYKQNPQMIKNYGTAKKIKHTYR
jgi:hypothetical protein